MGEESRSVDAVTKTHGLSTVFAVMQEPVGCSSGYVLLQLGICRYVQGLAVQQLWGCTVTCTVPASAITRHLRLR